LQLFASFEKTPLKTKLVEVLVGFARLAPPPSPPLLLLLLLPLTTKTCQRTSVARARFD
jgi:hypothetical protein